MKPKQQNYKISKKIGNSIKSVFIFVIVCIVLLMPGVTETIVKALQKIVPKIDFEESVKRIKYLARDFLQLGLSAFILLFSTFFFAWTLPIGILVFGLSSVFFGYNVLSTFKSIDLLFFGKEKKQTETETLLSGILYTLD